MKPVCDRFEPDWELVCLGALEPSEMDEALQHLSSGCVVCNEKFRAANERVAAVGSALPSKTPPRWNEQALLRRVASENTQPLAAKQVSARRSFPVAWGIAAALAATALLGWWQYGEASRQLSNAQTTIADLRSASTGSSPGAVADRQATTASTGNSVPLAESTPTELSETPHARAELGSSAVERPMPTATDEALLKELSGLRKQVDELLQRVAAAEQDRNLLLASYEASQTELQRLQEQREQAVVNRAASPPNEDPERQRVLRELQDSRRQQTLLTAELERTQRVLRILRAGDLKQVELQATDAKAGPGNARLLVSSQEGLVLVARQLPKLPPDKTYQLWIIGETNPAVVSGGLLRMDDGGAAVLVSASSETLRRATGFAITDEPRTGSIVAQGTKLMFGAL